SSRSCPRATSPSSTSGSEPAARRGRLGTGKAPQTGRGAGLRAAPAGLTCSLSRGKKPVVTTAETIPFQAETRELLQLVIHSLYKHKEIFLRELISNASDALDKLKYLNLMEEPYKSLPFNPRIDLEIDETAKTLTVFDTGIGMNHDDLVAHLGT